MFLGVAWIVGALFVAALRITPQRTFTPTYQIPSPMTTPQQPPATSFACPGCSRPLPVDARFCTQCGKTIITQCPICRATNTPGARFCRQCGEAIS